MIDWLIWFNSVSMALCRMSRQMSSQHWDRNEVLDIQQDLQTFGNTWACESAHWPESEVPQGRFIKIVLPQIYLIVPLHAPLYSVKPFFNNVQPGTRLAGARAARPALRSQGLSISLWKMECHYETTSSWNWKHYAAECKQNKAMTRAIILGGHGLVTRHTEDSVIHSG